MENENYSVFLVDDHTLFRNGLKGLLEHVAHHRVVAEAADGIEFLEKLPGCPADVILLDIDMPRMNGIEAATQALERYPDLKIITLSMYGDEDYYFKMVSLGVKGFILKNSEIKDVVAAIEAVAEGGSFFSQELLFNLVSNLKSTPSSVPEDSPEQLSQRESEILLHICRGESAFFLSELDKGHSQ